MALRLRVREVLSLSHEAEARVVAVRVDFWPLIKGLSTFMSQPLRARISGPLARSRGERR